MQKKHKYHINILHLHFPQWGLKWMVRSLYLHGYKCNGYHLCKLKKQPKTNVGFDWCRSIWMSFLCPSHDPTATNIEQLLMLVVFGSSVAYHFSQLVTLNAVSTQQINITNTLGNKTNRRATSGNLPNKRTKQQQRPEKTQWPLKNIMEEKYLECTKTKIKTQWFINNMSIIK